MNGINLTSAGDVIIPLGLERYFLALNEFNFERDVQATPWRKLNAECLEHFGMRPYQVGFLPKDWKHWPGADHFVNEIRSVLRSSKDWQADLQTGSGGNELLVPLYAEALKREGIFVVNFVIYFYDFLHKVPSKRGNDSNEPDDMRAVGLRAQYLLNALVNTKGLYRRVVPLENSIEERGTTARTISAVSQAPDFNGWPSILEEVFQLCVEASQNPDDLNAGTYDTRIDALCEEMSVLDAMANAVDLADDKMTFTWPGGKVEHPFCPSGSWQTLRLQLDAPKGAQVTFDPYQTPGYMWMRRFSIDVDDVRLTASTNGVLEEVYDVDRLTIFGPAPAGFRSPGPGQVELEFLIQSSDVIVKNVILTLSHKTAGGRSR